MKSANSYETFSEIKERLDWIVNQVSNDDLPLDQALSYYEEAVKLGTRVSTLIEDAQGEDEELLDTDTAEAAESSATSEAAESTASSASSVSSETPETPATPEAAETSATSTPSETPEPAESSKAPSKEQ
jgi:exodeoxyribonuclease VII small subunit